MMRVLNETHDPDQTSWIESANEPETDFPIQNLPHGVFELPGSSPRGGVAIGEMILDIGSALEAGLFEGPVAKIAEAAAEPSLNRLMAMGQDSASLLRAALFDLLKADGAKARTAEAERSRILVPASEVTMHLPVKIGAFTDFCTSVPHVSIDRPGRPEIPINPAFKHLPVGYNSRASTVVVSGTPVWRPNGQGQDEDSGEPYFGPSRRMDFELEFGMLVGSGNRWGEPVAIDRSPDQIWGYVLVNDWSARDIQNWETMLGPFLGKSLGTSMSPWVVTQEAMTPFAEAAPKRCDDDPKPFPYLTSARHEAEGGLNVQLQAYLSTARMRKEGLPSLCITDTNFRTSFWTMEQMLTHHTSNGCNLSPGDLLASGTVSGPELSEAACMWEITGGEVPLEMPGGEKRYWLEDGDEITFRGKAQAQGMRSIGFGTCRAVLEPAIDWSTVR